ncbi:hypothetical protein GCM10009574_093850 [Streptomyces asiaticus]|uniref:Transposase n=2 Tax=Streptomyces rhizosphaericus TaxID=114699 RepID=A0ABN1SRD7_9ACTN
MRGRGGRREGYCHRALLDAVRYLVDNGIKWRAMPADFPPWERVYAFFRRWRDHALVEEFHDRLRAQVRMRLGRDAEPTAGVIDSQSVKADAVVGTDSRGFDGGKNINGRKRHVVVDTLGLLLGVMVTAADVGDRTAAQAPLNRTVGVPPLGTQVRARCDVVETAASSSKTSHAPSAAAVALPAARSPSPIPPPPHRRVRPLDAQAADMTSRAAAATPTPRGPTTTRPAGLRSAAASARASTAHPANPELSRRTAAVVRV